MRTKKEIQNIYETLGVMFPDAHCELNHSSAYELCVAVLLSAQTTDKKVNDISGALFKRCPDVYALNEISYQELYEYIKMLGLAKSKATNLKGLAKKVIEDYHGEIPATMDELLTLPGIGRKSASVVLSCWYQIPAFPVDTHVDRTCKRLGIASKNDSVLMVEKKVCKGLDKEQYYNAHHRLIFFGRYMCKAQRPDCDKCLLQMYCKEK